MIIQLHQTKKHIGDFATTLETIKTICSNTYSQPHLILFPELYLTGYPLQDVCLQKPFYAQYLNFLAELNEIAKGWQCDREVTLLLGGLDYHFDENDLPINIKNVIFQMSPGSDLTPIYSKILLPNYDIFDERKYFTAGEEVITFKFAGKTIFPLICEDMWPSSHHAFNPVKIASEIYGDSIDLIINLSASPFEYTKKDRRETRAAEISSLLKAPFCYVNQVSGEDEIIFDGGSFITDGSEVVCSGKYFREDTLEWQFAPYSGEALPTLKKDEVTENTWESLFNAKLDYSAKLPTIESLSDEQAQMMLQAIAFGIQDYARKNGFDKFLVALSGGIDSSLALVITKMMLKEGQSVEAFFMPGLYTNPESYDLSKQLCENLAVPFKTAPIKFVHSAIRRQFADSFQVELEGLADENIQSRLRGALLYARSNQSGAMVLNTSNKSEIAVGYSTLYGDSVGAISPLGDVYKSEVFELCHYLNRTTNNIIPEGIITRPPSAELRENQKDSDSLPSYEVLDAILECILSNRYNYEDILQLGFKKTDIKQAFDLFYKSEYKRKQFCPIIKVRPKSFGFGHRQPISKVFHL